MRNRECKQWIQKDVGGTDWRSIVLTRRETAKTTKKFFSLESAAVQSLCTYANLLCSEVKGKEKKSQPLLAVLYRRSKTSSRVPEFTFCSNSWRPQNNRNTRETRMFLFMCVFVFVLCVLLYLLSCAISFIAFSKFSSFRIHAMQALGGRGSIAPAHSWPHPYLVFPLFLT
jgi:hypothetical protein